MTQIDSKMPVTGLVQSPVSSETDKKVGGTDSKLAPKISAAQQNGREKVAQSQKGPAPGKSPGISPESAVLLTPNKTKPGTVYSDIGVLMREAIGGKMPLGKAFSGLADIRKEVPPGATYQEIQQDLNLLERDLTLRPFAHLARLGGKEGGSLAVKADSLLQQLREAESPEEIGKIKTELGKLEKQCADLLKTLDPAKTGTLKDDMKASFAHLSQGLELKAGLAREQASLKDKMGALNSLAQAMKSYASGDAAATGAELKNLLAACAKAGLTLKPEWQKAAAGKPSLEACGALLREINLALEAKGLGRGKVDAAIADCNAKVPDDLLCGNLGTDECELGKVRADADAALSQVRGLLKDTVLPAIQTFPDKVPEQFKEKSFGDIVKLARQCQEFLGLDATALDGVLEFKALHDAGLQAIEKGNVDAMTAAHDRIVSCLNDPALTFTDQERQELRADLGKLFTGLDQVDKDFSKTVDSLKGDLAKALEEAGKTGRGTALDAVARDIDEEINQVEKHLGQGSLVKEEFLQQLYDLKSAISLEKFKIELASKGSSLTQGTTVAQMREEISKTDAKENPQKTEQLKLLDAFSARQLTEAKKSLAMLQEAGLKDLGKTEQDITGKAAVFQARLKSLEGRYGALLGEQDLAAFKKELEQAGAEVNTASAKALLALPESSLSALHKELDPGQKAALATILANGGCHPQLCYLLGKGDVAGMKAMLSNIALIKEGSPDYRTRLDKAMADLDALTISSSTLDEGILAVKLALAAPADSGQVTDQHVNSHLKQYLFTMLQQEGQALLEQYQIKDASKIDLALLQKMMQGMEGDSFSPFDLILAKTLWSEMSVQGDKARKEVSFDDFMAMLPKHLQDMGEARLKSTFDTGTLSTRDLVEARANMEQINILFTHKSVRKIINRLCMQDDKLRARDAVTTMLRNMRYAGGKDFVVRDLVYDPTLGGSYENICLKWIADALGSASSLRKGGIDKQMAAFLSKFPDVQAKLASLESEEGKLAELRKAVANAMTEDHEKILRNQGCVDGKDKIRHDKIQGETLSCIILGLGNILTPQDPKVYADSKKQLEAFQQFKIPTKINLQSMTSQSGAVGRGKSMDADGKKFIELLTNIQSLDPGQKDFEAKFTAAKGALQTFMEGRDLHDKAQFILTMKGTSAAASRESVGAKGAKVSGKMGHGGDALLRGIKKALKNPGSEAGKTIGSAIIRENAALRGSGKARTVVGQVVSKEQVAALKNQEKLLRSLRADFSSQVDSTLTQAGNMAILRAFCEQEQFKSFEELETSLRDSRDYTANPVFRKAVAILQTDFGLSEELAETMIKAQMTPARLGAGPSPLIKVAAKGAEHIPVLGGLLAPKPKDYDNPDSAFNKMIESAHTPLGLKHLNSQQLKALSPEERGRLEDKARLEEAKSLLGLLENGQTLSFDRKFGVQVGATVSTEHFDLDAVCRLTNEKGMVFSRTPEGKYVLSVRQTDALSVGLSVSALDSMVKAGLGLKGEMGDGTMLTFDSLENCNAFMERLFTGEWEPSDVSAYASKIEVTRNKGGGVYASLEVSSPSLSLISALPLEVGFSCKAEILAQGQTNQRIDVQEKTKTTNTESAWQLTFSASVSLGLASGDEEEDGGSGSTSVKLGGDDAKEILDTLDQPIEGKEGVDFSVSPGKTTTVSMSLTSRSVSSVSRSTEDGALKEASVTQRVPFKGKNCFPQIHSFLVGPMGMPAKDADAVVRTLQASGSDSFTLEVESTMRPDVLGRINLLEGRNREVADPKTLSPKELAEYKAREKEIKQLLSAPGSYERTHLDFEREIDGKSASLPAPLNLLFIRDIKGSYSERLGIALGTYGKTG